MCRLWVSILALLCVLATSAGAGERLVRKGTRLDLEKMLRELKSGDQKTRVRAAAALADTVGQVTWKLSQTVRKSRDPKTRAAALQACRVVNYKWTLYSYKSLYSCLLEPMTAYEAGLAMVTIGEAAVPKLVESCKWAGNTREKVAVVNTLAQFGPRAQAAIPLLLAELQKTEDESLRMAIIRALGAIARHGPALKMAVAAVGKYRRSESKYYRQAAVISLARMDLSVVGPEELLFAMDGKLSGCSPEARKLIVAMGQRAAPALVNALDQKERNRRAAAVLALIYVVPKDPKLQERLAKYLEDKDDFVRWRVAVSLGLGGYGKGKTVEVLCDYHARGRTPAREREPGPRAAYRKIGKPATVGMVDYALDLYRKNKKDPPLVMRQLLWDVAAIGADDPEIIPKMFEIIGNGEDVRSNRVPAAVGVIGALGAKGAPAIPRLEKLMRRQKRHRGIVDAVQEALKKIKAAQEKKPAP